MPPESGFAVEQGGLVLPPLGKQRRQHVGAQRNGQDADLCDQDTMRSSADQENRSGWCRRWSSIRSPRRSGRPPLPRTPAGNAMRSTTGVGNSSATGTMVFQWARRQGDCDGDHDQQHRKCQQALDGLAAGWRLACDPGEADHQRRNRNDAEAVGCEPVLPDDEQRACRIMEQRESQGLRRRPRLQPRQSRLQAAPARSAAC